MTRKYLLGPVQNSLLFPVLIKLSGFAKVSFILGSQVAFFTACAVITPLSGAFAGLAGSFGVFAVGIMLRLILMGTMPLHFLAYHIPGLFASFYWASSSRFIRLAPAILCMLLFITHPVGGQAALYGLFWLIPVALTLFAQETLFTRALGSTFTAHAVGSVIWLYTVPMSADQWLMLIPVVIMERLLFAAGMVAGYKVIEWVLMNLKTLRYTAQVRHSGRTEKNPVRGE